MPYGTLALDAISTSGNLAVTGNVSASGNLTVTGTIASSTGTTYPLVADTAKTTTSGTNIDFTGIPSWVKRITVMFNGVSTNGSSFVQIQVGSGSFTTSGYSGSVSNGSTNISLSAGFLFHAVNGASYNANGMIILTKLSANIWTATGINGFSGVASVHFMGGVVSLSGVLDQIRITTVNGTDTFDAGSVNILYE